MTERDKSIYLMLGTDAEKKRPSVVCGEVNNAIYDESGGRKLRRSFQRCRH